MSFICKSISLILFTQTISWSQLSGHLESSFQTAFPCCQSHYLSHGPCLHSPQSITPNRSPNFVLPPLYCFVKKAKLKPVSLPIVNGILNIIGAMCVCVSDLCPSLTVMQYETLFTTASLFITFFNMCEVSAVWGA